MDVQTIRSLRHEERYDDVIKLGENAIAYIPLNPLLYEELCIAYYHVGRFEESYACLDKIMSMRPHNSELLDRTVSNKLLYLNHFLSNKWQPGQIERTDTEPIVTVTITSCKRLELFLRTIESFTRCCVDKHLIREYICVDDNSSEEDRAVMKETFPFIRYIFKTPEEKGHVASMKMIAGLNIATPYVLHLEDDWLFFNRICISDMLEIMNSKRDIKQVAINKDYNTSPGKMAGAGGKECWTDGDLRYFLHEYCQTKEQQEDFNKRHGPVTSCSYWPHFTLQPSLIDASVFKTLEFREVPHFEMDYARQYAEKGWKTAFLQESNTQHIGKNYNDQEGSNAYELNNVRQF